MVIWAAANIVGGSPSSPYYDPEAAASLSELGEGVLRGLGGTSLGDAANAPGTSSSGSSQYPVSPARGEVLGTLSIPALGQSFPVYEGTGDDELARGVGHMDDTAFPGEPDNCVISGHRDTVFSGLGQLKLGDHLLLETATGVHDYVISRVRIVDKDDLTVVVPADRAILTVSTCYPFQYVGSAPERYVLTAELASSP